MSDWFVAIDVETANQNRQSICQIGLVAFQEQKELWRWTTNVNPEENFSAANVGIHGIRSADVTMAPKFPEVLAIIAPSLVGQFLVSHTHFDRDAIAAAAAKYDLAAPSSSWLDSCAIARQVWPDLKDHKLKTMADYLGLDLQHHSAVHDAAVSGRILVQAMTETNTPLSGWEACRAEHLADPPDASTHLERRPRYSEKIELGGRQGGPLAGHVVVFTGEFSVGEFRMAQIASDLGCDVEDRFKKKRTTILVVGERDPEKFNGKLKSNKQLSAEAAVAEGCDITIMDERSFHELASKLVLT